MNKYIIKIINDMVWYIPFKKLRNSVREYLLYNKEINSNLVEISNSSEKIKEINSRLSKIENDDLNPIYNLHKKALNETVDYIENHLHTALLFNHKFDLLQYCMGILIETFGNKINEKLLLEFGVFRGETINFYSNILNNVDFYGFDSFEGLPEDWKGYNVSKKTFDTCGYIPNVNKNVHLIKGYFDKSLPIFLNEHLNRDIIFMHIDCDLYSSTKTVFDNVYNRLIIGSVIVFDEYYNYPNWKNHEYKAFQEFCKKYEVKYEYIGFSYQQAAVKIIEIQTRPDQTRPDQTRPDQTRPDQTRPDHELICKDYICFYNNVKYKKTQPILKYKISV